MWHIGRESECYPEGCGFESWHNLFEESESLVYHTNPVGPDQLCAANSIYSDKLDVPVLLRSKPVDSKKFPPMSIYTMFKRTVEAEPDKSALAYKSNGVWCYFSYKEYFNICTKAAKSLIKVSLFE